MSNRFEYKVVTSLAVLFILYTPLNLLATESKLYRSTFNHVEMSAEVEPILRDIANRWSLRFHKKDRNQMQTLTRGEPAFYYAFYYENDVVLSVNNVGVGDIVTVMVTDHGRMPPDELERVLKDTVMNLERCLGLSFSIYVD